MKTIELMEPYSDACGRSSDLDVRSSVGKEKAQPPRGYACIAYRTPRVDPRYSRPLGTMTTLLPSLSLTHPAATALKGYMGADSDITRYTLGISLRGTISAKPAPMLRLP